LCTGQNSTIFKELIKCLENDKTDVKIELLETEKHIKGFVKFFLKKIKAEHKIKKTNNSKYS
jgi:hypothetical protein